MHRTLIVAKFKVDDPQRIADVFAESDATDLPRLVGVSRRTLFGFHDLYFHLIESEAGLAPNLSKVRDHPLYRDIDTRLAELVAPYDPGWREPKDAMASPFYVWTAKDGSAR
ncbi:TcmI family type II polyketide cyclase [Amycolatopsis sp. lyj-90]|uniref:TcmI family type II polyketide cyclase n=1 Tax=Amycolatopsis sp. lyj-90 TaxID=2789285 RepID=UPI003978E83A